MYGAITVSTFIPTRLSASTESAGPRRAIAMTALPLMSRPESGSVRSNPYHLTSIPLCCASPDAAKRSVASRLATVRIHSTERAVRHWHLLPTRDRLLGGLRHLRRHVSLDIAELLGLHAFFFQVLLIKPNGIALPPRAKQVGWKRVPSLALVMRGMAAHAERLRNQQRRPIPRSTPLGGDSCDRVRVEHVVAVEGRSPNAVACGPILEIGGEMVLLETRTQRDLIVLDDENGGDVLDGREVGALMRRGGLGRSIADPRERHTRLTLDLEGQRDPRDHRHHVAHVRDRLQHAVGEGADMKVAPGARRIGGGEVGAQHVGDRHPHLAARRGVADHRRDDVFAALERLHRPDRGRFFAGAQPRLRDDAGADPALQLDVMQPGPQQAAVHLELGVARQPAHDCGTLGICFDGGAERLHEGGIRFPIDVLRWVERGEPLHGTPATLRPRTCPSRLNTRPFFITNKTVSRTWMLSSGLPCTATISACLPTATVPISRSRPSRVAPLDVPATIACMGVMRSEEHTSELQSLAYL